MNVVLSVFAEKFEREIALFGVSRLDDRRFLETRNQGDESWVDFGWCYGGGRCYTDVWNDVCWQND